MVVEDRCLIIFDTVVMKGEISFTDQNRCLYQTVNMFISAVKLDILTWGSVGIDSLLEPQVVVQGTAGFGFILQPRRLLLGSDSGS